MYAAPSNIKELLGMDSGCGNAAGGICLPSIPGSFLVFEG